MSQKNNIMNIGYVLLAFPRLPETFVLNEIAELIKRGHHVYIFSIYPPQETIFHREFNESNLSKNTYYFINPKKRLNRIRLSLKSVGLFGWKYPSENLGSRVYSIAAAKYFCKIAKNLSIDVLHAHFNGEATHTAMLMSKKLGTPFTFEAHAIDIFVKPCLKALEKRMREASATTTISYYNRDYLHKLTNINMKKIHVVRACPVIDKFKSVKRNPEALSILTVGRLVEKKGIKYGILAIKELIKDYPEIQYSIVGLGPLETELKSLARMVDLQNNVRFLGNLDDNSLIDELRKATIFILPCVIAKNEDRDGIPVSLMESMYLRIPTVSTNISGISELIEDGREGFLVEPGNSEQLASAIKTLLENENLRITMGVNGRKKIATQFNIHKEIGKLLGIWETNKK